MLVGDEEDAPDKLAIVVLGVEARGGEVPRPPGGVRVRQVVVEGQQVDVMHHEVVAGCVHAKQVSDVDQRAEVEPEGWIKNDTA